MPQPFTRHEEYWSVAFANITEGAAYYLNDSPSPWASFNGGPNLATVSGTPTGATTNPCFLNPDGSGMEYLKLDPGDKIQGSYDPYHLRVGLMGWVRLDALPAADAPIFGMNTGCWVGVNTSGHLYAQRGGTLQGTWATPMVIGRWYHVGKCNDSDGSGTIYRLYVDGAEMAVTGVGGTGADNIFMGSTDFDGAISNYCYVDASSATFALANYRPCYNGGARKIDTRRAVML